MTRVRSSRNSYFVRLASAAVAAVILTGCGSLNPIPLGKKELQDGLAADLKAARADIEPIQGKITLEGAIARALKYNLERRSRMMEEAIAFNQLEAGKYDMLPRLVAQAGYRWRDEEIITRSKDSVTGAPSLTNPFISSERIHNIFDLGLTWNMLDFGASYYGARQNANRVQIALERRRKAMHLLIQDVRSAFWRTASAQRLQQRVADTIVIAEDALRDARKAEIEQNKSPVENLRYQRQVLENLRLLEATNQELATARLELLHLMNVPLAYRLEVAESAEAVSPRILEAPVERLEEIAVGLNAELREQFYNARIARDETRRVLLRLFPGISFNYNWKYDTDNYLVNQHWREAGAVISFNLFNLVSAPAQMRLADAGVALADQRRVTSQLAVLTQVHIARLQYANALEQYERADAVAKVDERLDVIMSKREKAEVQGKLETVANRTTAILSLLRRYQALAQAHTAAGRLQASLGIEPEFGSMQDLSVADLTAIVAKTLDAWNRGELPSGDQMFKTSANDPVELPQPARTEPEQPSTTLLPRLASAEESGAPEGLKLTLDTRLHPKEQVAAHRDESRIPTEQAQPMSEISLAMTLSSR